MKYLLFMCSIIVVVVKINAVAKKPVTKPKPVTTLAPETTTVTEEPVESTTLIITTTTEIPTTPPPVTLPETPAGTYTVPYYPRSIWGARDPLNSNILNNTQAPYMVVHDSGEPPMVEVAGCFNVTECSAAMKVIQNQHVDVNGWWDIGYNFAIGGDGAIYEGRGWGILGAHVKHFNTVSMGVAFIGSYNKLVPTLLQVSAFNDLIAAGIRLGYLRPDYRLINHGQIKGTLCPGKKLSKKVLTWPHYSIFPSSLKDLLDIPEIPDYVKDEIRKEIVSVSDAV